MSATPSSSSPPSLRLGVCLGAAALLAACGTTYLAPEARVYSELKAVPFLNRQPDTVEIHLRNGHVLVQHGEMLEGDMNIEVWGEDARQARERARAVNLFPRPADEGVCQLRVTHAPGAPLDDMQVRYRLRVPPTVKLRVFTRSAQVAVRGYRGDIEVHSESGEIDARPAGGSCTLFAGSGPIRLGGTFARADITSESGDVDVTLAPVTDEVRFVARSRTGRLRVDMADDCRMWLRFTTHNGALDTDFPVFWRDSGPTEDKLARRYVGSVGDADRAEKIDATVICGDAKFQLRRLPRATPMNPRPR